MMLYILIDSSTKPTSRADKYEESVAAWAAWWGNPINGKPIRAGIIYIRREGPNKTFYEGVIRSLEQCLSICWKDDVTVWGDCEPVIKQLNGQWLVGSMQMQFDQVQALIKKYRQKNNNINFRYLTEENELYRKIDQLAKRSIDHVVKILKFSKKR